MTDTDLRPLAERMRPLTLDDIVGQDDLLRPGSALRRIVAGHPASSIILWGPPGSGKSTLAGVIARTTASQFTQLSATSAGVKDVRTVITAAVRLKAEKNTATILFIDEIHRFSKSQQDVLLPVVEDGTITLVAATTENPSFSVISPLLSRSQLLVLQPLGDSDIVAILESALFSPNGLQAGVRVGDHVLNKIAQLSSGDARRALTYLQECAASATAQGETIISLDLLATVAQRAIAVFDKDGDSHYDIISAFIKSMRGSDPDGAVHWLIRMIEAGEDPTYIARRLMVHASEDVGMADPGVLTTCVAAAQAVALIGMPEARIILTHATLAVTLAPKSRSVMGALGGAEADVREGRTGPVPMHLRDAHYKGAKALGHGAGYLMPANYPHSVVAQQYLPDAALGAHHYTPTDRGFEKVVATRLAAIAALTTPPERSTSS